VRSGAAAVGVREAPARCPQRLLGDGTVPTLPFRSIHFLSPFLLSFLLSFFPSFFPSFLSFFQFVLLFEEGRREDEGFNSKLKSKSKSKSFTFFFVVVFLGRRKYRNVVNIRCGNPISRSRSDLIGAFAEGHK